MIYGKEVIEDKTLNPCSWTHQKNAIWMLAHFPSLQDMGAIQVAGRLTHASDCCAYDVVYHNFIAPISVQATKYHKHLKKKNTGGKNIGRSPWKPKHGCCFSICCWAHWKLTFQELIIVMQYSLGGDRATLQAYTAHHMKKKLKNYFGEDILFADLGSGKSDVVNLKRNMNPTFCMVFTWEQSMQMKWPRRQNLYKQQDSWFWMR